MAAGSRLNQWWLSVFGPAALALSALLGASGAVAQNVPGTGIHPSRPADVQLEGTITRADFQTYKRIPFTVPDKVDRLVVAFDYDGREQRTVIDLGVEDPHGLRGASGGNKAGFTIAYADATPSYLPGPVEAGLWKLALAIPNIRAGVTSHWHARIWFLRGAEAENLPSPTAGRGAGWYRGDLHLHSAHSDGSCASQTGRKVPCPLFRTLERASAEKLDFVAVTEHNTASHAQMLREAQPYFDRLLLIPGREITTFFGHFNIFGMTGPLDFRETLQAGGFNRLADQAHALGALVSINHPALPSGEACMGCGWTMADVDYGKVDAMEIVNGGTLEQVGGDAEGLFSGVPVWLRHLREGRSIAAVGGSDNHDPDKNGRGGLGHPVTVVFASDLTQPAILEGLRQGRSFIALDPAVALHLDFTASSGLQNAAMGGRLPVQRGKLVSIVADASGPQGARLELLDGEQVLATRPVAGGRTDLARDLRFERGLHILRVRMRGGDGTIIALGNVIRVAAE